MLKKLLVFSMVVVCCYCDEEIKDVILPEETRAKKKKTLRLMAMIALFVLSKVVIIKAAAFFFFLAFFQKLFSVGGVLLTYFMKNQLGMVMGQPTAMTSQSPSVPPSTSYGSPDYNTLGYSYGPPEHEAAFQGSPGLSDFGSPYNWILKP